MTKIIPLVICGGNGTRLWPVSRTQSPKQFQRVGDEDTQSFFQMALERHSGPDYDTPWIISSLRHRETVKAQLAEIGKTARLLLEPTGRNTGPAVLAAAIAIHAVDPEALILVVPADHVIEGDVNTPIVAMTAAARAGYIISFGVKPRHPETGFGYVCDGGPIKGFPGLRKVDSFVEKPPLQKAQELIDGGNAYWASGISMFSAATIITEYEKFDPASATAVRFALLRGRQTETALELNAEFFAAAQAGPTEAIVFERTDKIAMTELPVQWSDVGSWTAMYGISKSNPQGNVLHGDVVAVETSNSLVRASTRLVTLVGLDSVIVIDTPDALLVTKVGHDQSVKKVAEYLKSASRIEAEAHKDMTEVGASTQYGHMAPIFQTDSLEMVTARIAPGQSMMLDAVNDRQLIVARGEVSVITLKSQLHLREGQKTQLISSLPTMLVNPANVDVEIALITLLGSKTLPEDATVATEKVADPNSSAAA